MERNRKAGQNPPRVVAPTKEEEEEEEEEVQKRKNVINWIIIIISHYLIMSISRILTILYLKKNMFLGYMRGGPKNSRNC